MIKGEVDDNIFRYPHLGYPAVTICPKVSTKYGIAERLGNYIDPNNLPEKILTLKKELFKCRFNSSLDLDKKDSFYKGCGKTQMLVSSRVLITRSVPCYVFYT